MNKDLTSRNGVVVFTSILFGLIYVLWFLRRNLAGYDVGAGGVWGTINSFTTIIPFLAFVPLFALETKRDNVIAKTWRRICLDIPRVLYIGIFVCFALTAVHVTGLGWTWMSVGLMCCFTLLAIISLQMYMPLEKATIAAVGALAFFVGVWEVPFRFVAYQHYGTQYWPAGPFLTYAVLQLLPNILGGAFILWFYNRTYHVARFNNWFWAFVAVFVLAWAVWVLLGFWIDPIYNGKEIVYNSTTSTSYLQNAIGFRGTKVWLGLVILFGACGLNKLLSSPSEQSTH